MNLGQIYETVLGWAGAVWNSLPLSSMALQRSKSTHTWSKPAYLKMGLLTSMTVELANDSTNPLLLDTSICWNFTTWLILRCTPVASGPYSLITQQPLGGKAQFGGQRFWRNGSLGSGSFRSCKHTRKFNKTYDVIGRAKAYEAIVMGIIFTPSIPESFNVLVHELSCLGLDVSFE